MKKLTRGKGDRDALVAQLREQGVRFLAPSQVDLPVSPRVSPNELILRLSSHPDARLRLALIALLILHPSWGLYAHSEMHDLAEPLRTELQALYTAAVYLQRLWHTRLGIYLGKFDVLPDLYSSQLGLPAAEERHGKAGLHALSAWQTRRSSYPFNWLASYNKVMNLLFGQLKMEAKQSEPAPPVDRQRIEEFLRHLSQKYPRPARIYLVGGTTMVFEGFRRQTLYIDLAFEVAGENHGALIQAIRELKEELSLNVEEASPGDFIPLPKGYRERSRFVGRYGQIDVFHFDLYSMALSKIERGTEEDFSDVLLLLRSGEIDFQTLEAYHSECRSWE